MSDTDWLDLLPDDVGDEQYRADVRSEASARTRRAGVDQMLAGLEEQLAGRAHDPSTDPMTLLGLAGDVQAARAVRAALPPMIAVDVRRHEQVVTALQSRLPQFRMPPPPRLAVEMRHWVARHASGKTLPPEPLASDKPTIAAYEMVSAALARFEADHFGYLRKPWAERGEVGAWVRAWHAAMNQDDQLEYLRGILEELLASLELNDKQRSEEAPHQCAYGSADTFRLQPPSASEPWTYRDEAINGVLIRG